MLRRRGYDSLIAFLDEPPHERSLRKLVCRVRAVTAVESFAQRMVSIVSRHHDG